MKKQRIRIHFSKIESMRYTSHLDLILTWERTFRRADLPLAYSEGYSPRPILTMAAPLPLGYTSIGEMGDFWLSENIPIDTISRSLVTALPPGLQSNNILEIADLHAPKLPTLVIAASYLVSFDEVHQDIKAKIDSVIQKEELIRIWKNKQYDLRPLIKKITLIQSTAEPQEISMTLTALPGATGRPDEVVSAIEIQPILVKFCRTEIILK